MANGTYEQRPNSGSAFKARQNEEGEFNGNADIENEAYRVVVEKAEVGEKHTTRPVTFNPTQPGNTSVWTGQMFDNRRDSATGQEKALREKQPAFSGSIKCVVSPELTVTKRVAAWVRQTKKGDDWLSLSISDPKVPGVGDAAVADGDAPF
jgi:hypothetical protein